MVDLLSDFVATVKIVGRTVFSVPSEEVLKPDIEVCLIMKEVSVQDVDVCVQVEHRLPTVTFPVLANKHEQFNGLSCKSTWNPSTSLKSGHIMLLRRNERN